VEPDGAGRGGSEDNQTIAWTMQAGHDADEIIGTRLSAGTGVSGKPMRETNGASIQTHMNTLQNGPSPIQGSATLDELRVTLSRAARRRQTYATANAGRLARRNRSVYRA
jgi:hypothetical protein